MNDRVIPGAAVSADWPGRSGVPGAAGRRRIAWPYAIGVVGCHLIALLAVLPWFFSWTGVALALLGLFFLGTLGINVCYHRLLAHRGFACPKWLEHSLAVLGVCCLQDTPARWVAVHRRHHQHADEPLDPHSPLVGFFWAHMGWLLVDNNALQDLGTCERYSKDILRDPFYRMLERGWWWVWIALLSWFVFWLGGFGGELLIGGGTIMEAVRFGSSVLIWGVFVRTVAVWHITWSVNSVTHLWGYRRYATDEESRNNVLIGILSNGEGWHNNHHADPRSAKHGRIWWELDVAYLTIRFLSLIGFARNVIMPGPRPVPAGADGRLLTRAQAFAQGD